MKRVMRHARTAAVLALLAAAEPGDGVRPRGCRASPGRAVFRARGTTEASSEGANPASVHCAEVGGRLVIEKSPAGGEFGVCYFEDNHQCEEWALLRGKCPVGGRRITGYATQAGRYCAITGGQYTDVTGNDASDEHGNCILPGGKKCEAEAYWRGTCTR